MKKKYALISVSDKKYLKELAEALIRAGYTLISTGGTAKKLKELGIPVTLIEDFTGFKECLDGRVKTLHPKVHAGLLYVRGNPAHKKTIQELNYEDIDVVVVNLYPFEATIAKPEAALSECVENIDIGGPAMLRSAAKNYKTLTVLTDPEDYQEVINQLNESKIVNSNFRVYLARKVYETTSEYDAAVAEWMESHGDELIAEAT